MRSALKNYPHLIKDHKADITPIGRSGSAVRPAGEFEAIVSIFGNVDLVGDRVMRGAFRKSIEEWERSGDPIPVLWAHDWSNPSAHIGAVTDIEERNSGLWVKGTLDLDRPLAEQVWHLMETRRVREFSFAYDVKRERSAADGANELVELDIIEVGPTLKGVNPETMLLSVKSASGPGPDAELRRQLATLADEAYSSAKIARRFDSGPLYTTRAVLDVFDRLLYDSRWIARSLR